MEYNRFCFLVPTYNAEKTIVQMLLSVYSQTYANWKLIIRDDLSTDRTVEIIRAFRESLNLQDKIHLTANTDKFWETRNVVEAMKECEENDICCRLDGDDWLSDLDALTMINQIYNEKGCDLLWTSHRWGYSDITLSGPMPTGTDPYKHPWVASHLKTYRKYLLSGINDENYRGPDGDYLKRTGDQAIYLPALYRAKKWWFEPRVVYHYTKDMSPEEYGETADNRYERELEQFIRQRGFVQ